MPQRLQRREKEDEEDEEEKTLYRLLVAIAEL